MALAVSETVYMAEIHRGDLLAVQNGQTEAARPLGIGFVGTLRLEFAQSCDRKSVTSKQSQTWYYDSRQLYLNESATGQ